MGEKTTIEWCDRTFKGIEWVADAERRDTAVDGWLAPLKWNRQAIAAGERRRVFCGSLCDVFEENVHLNDQRVALMQLIENTPALDWLLLTKRSSYAQRYLSAPLAGAFLGDAGTRNLWIGASVENQEWLVKRYSHLMATPAAGRFLSVEPQLEKIDLSVAFAECGPCDWVICGGESTPAARKFETRWAESLKLQCRAAGVPFFMKQVGAKPIGPRGPIDLADGDLRGASYASIPLSLHVRQFPDFAAAASRLPTSVAGAD